MDFDRATYQVYERLMEDLSISTPVFHQESNTHSNRSTTIRRRRNHNNHNNGDDNNDSERAAQVENNGSGISSSDVSAPVLDSNAAASSSIATSSTDNDATTTDTTDTNDPNDIFTRQTNIRMQMNRRGQNGPPPPTTISSSGVMLVVGGGRGSSSSSSSANMMIPFILPVIVSPYTEAFMDAMSKDGSWRRFWDTVRYHHQTTTTSQQTSSTTMTTTSSSMWNRWVSNSHRNITTWISIRRRNSTTSNATASSSALYNSLFYSNEDHHHRHADDDEEEGTSFHSTSSQNNSNSSVSSSTPRRSNTATATVTSSSPVEQQRHQEVEMMTLAPSYSTESNVSTTSSTNSSSNGSPSRSTLRRRSSLSISPRSSPPPTPTTTTTTATPEFVGVNDEFNNNGSSITSNSSSSISANSSNEDDQTTTTTTTTTTTAATILPPSQLNNNNDNNQNDYEGNCLCTTQKGLYTLMRVFLFLGILHLGILRLLHKTYIGPDIQKDFPTFTSPSTTTTSSSSSSSSLRNVRTCLEYALSTRPKEQRSQYQTNTHHSHYRYISEENTNINDNNEEEEETDNLLLLGKNEILQVIILYGGKCTSGKCSRVHQVMDTVTTSDDVDDSNNNNNNNKNNNNNGHDDDGFGQGFTRRIKDVTIENNMMETATFWKYPDYRYSTDQALMYLDNQMLSWYNISFVNVTLTEQCLSTGQDYHDHDDGIGDDESSGSSSSSSSSSRGKGLSIQTRLAQYLTSNLYGMDAVMMNQFMYGIRSNNGNFRNGHMQNYETSERWTIKKQLLEYEEILRDEKHHFFYWVWQKIQIILSSLLAFFLLTSVTAFTVRILSSSGVCIMFPIFRLLRSTGLILADELILQYSYPWIYVAQAAIERLDIHPSSDFIMAHLAKVFLSYMMYYACQMAWGDFLYPKSMPADLLVLIYGFSMMLEYFSLFFLRSAVSVFFFPRITLLYFISFHIYLYSVPYGFFGIALVPCCCFIVHAMLFTLIALELPASSRGAISTECPREVYSRLSWPEWNASIPNEWTIFLPLNSRYVPIHDREIDTGGTIQNTMSAGDDGGDDDLNSVDQSEMSGEEDGTSGGGGDGEEESNSRGEDLLSLPLGNGESDRATELRPIT